MKLSLCLVGLLFLASCAGDEATLEEAKYYLGQGGLSNASKAKALVEPLLTSGDSRVKLEAHRLYSGALMAEAGFDSVTIVSHMVYKDSSEASISAIRPAISLNDNTVTYLASAEEKLTSLLADSAYTECKDARLKAGLNLQLGLVYFFQAVRNTLVTADIQTSGTALTVAECKSRYNSVLANKETLASIRPDLQSSVTSLEDGAGLEAENSLVKAVVSLRDKAPNVSSYTDITDDMLTNFCTYLVQENNR